MANLELRDIEAGITKPGADAFQSAYNAGQKSKSDQALQASAQDAALRQLLQGKNADAANTYAKQAQEGDIATQAATHGQELKQQGSAFDLQQAQAANEAAHRRGGKSSVKVGDSSITDQEYNPYQMQAKQASMSRADEKSLSKDRAKDTGWDSASDDLEALTNRDGKGGILSNPNAQLVSTGGMKSMIPGSMMGLAELTGAVPKGSTEESKALQRYINEYSKAMSGVRLPPEAAARNRQAMGYVSSGDPELVKKGVQALNEAMRLKHETQDSGYSPDVVSTVNSRMSGGSPNNRYSKIPAVQPAGTPQAASGGGQMPSVDAIQAEIARRRGGK